MALIARVRYLPPTNFKGARLKATVKDGSFSESAVVDGNNRSMEDAVVALTRKLKAKHGFFWDAEPVIKIAGSFDGDVYVTMFGHKE
jgi:hypothetical protein